MFLSCGSRSARDVAREFGIGHATLFAWLNEAEISHEKIDNNLTPESWTFSKKLKMISIFDSLPDSERGKFLRKQGLTSVHVDKWRTSIHVTLDKRDQEKIRLKQKVRILERDLEKRTKHSLRQRHF